jgi:hypothetical protein
LVPGPYLVLGSVLGPGFLVHPCERTMDKGRRTDQEPGPLGTVERFPAYYTDVKSAVMALLSAERNVAAL